MLLVDSQVLTEATRQFGMLGGDDFIHHAAHRSLDVDGRVLPCFRNASRQHDMAIEDGARGIRDRILLVVTLREHRIESGDGAPPRGAVTGALDQRGKPREDRRRITARRRRFADGEADLTLRLGKPCQRIHDQEHGQSALAKIFGDGRGEPRAMQANQRRVVGRRRHHHGTAAAFGAENAIHEFLHFAAALAYQADDDDVGAGVARHHAEQHALADA